MCESNSFNTRKECKKLISSESVFSSVKWVQSSSISQAIEGVSGAGSEVAPERGSELIGKGEEAQTAEWTETRTMKRTSQGYIVRPCVKQTNRILVYA